MSLPPVELSAKLKSYSISCGIRRRTGNQLSRLKARQRSVTQANNADDEDDDDDASKSAAHQSAVRKVAKEKQLDVAVAATITANVVG